MQAVVHHLVPNDHVDWLAFAQCEPPDPYDDIGWFGVTTGASDLVIGGTGFQVCVATPQAVNRAKLAGTVPRILVDHFDAETTWVAIHKRIESTTGHSWEQLIEQLRKFMLLKYEGMDGR